MGSYGQYCPVAKAAEIFADRWTLLIVREMLHGICHFNELERGLPGIPRSLLAQRLRRLAQAGVIERRVTPKGRATEYHLTQAGRQLEAVVDALGAWGVQWAFGDPEPDELDPPLLLWWMKRRVNVHLLPPQRIVVQFDFRGERTGSYWLVMEPTDISLCLQHPGFDTDLLVTADIAAFYRVWLGRITLTEALRDGLVELYGTTPLVRAFQGWFALSPFANVVRAASANTPTAKDSTAS
jgi:DNA-binding HxlR family transcriptional regulator